MMFKKIFKNKTDAEPQKEEKPQTNAGVQERTEGRPFKIDLSDLWKYDFDELAEFIQKYESYLTVIVNKYNDVASELRLTKEKADLLDGERKRLMQELDHQKIYIDNLKQSLNEQSLSESINSPLRLQTPTASADKQQIEELIRNKIKIKGIEPKLLDEVRVNGESIVNQLMEAREFFVEKSAVPIREQKPVDKENNLDDKSEMAININEIVENDTNEQTGSKPGSDTNVKSESSIKNQEGSDDVMYIKVRKSFKEKLNQNIEDIEMILQLIVPKFLEINNTIKQREQDFMQLLKGDFLDSLRQLDDTQKEHVSAEHANELEAKANEYRNKLIKIESTISELRSEINQKNEHINKLKKAQEDLVEEKKAVQRTLDKHTESHNAECNNYNETINELQGKIDSLQLSLKEANSKNSASQNEYELAKEESKQIKLARQQSDEKNVSVIGSLQSALTTLEEEKEKLKKKIGNIEQDKLDVENKLIQEKLKHHQTQSDLQKVKENLADAQRDLNEEIENRKTDLKKYEDVKRQLIDKDKKSKEYKKAIKKLSQQIIDMENKANQNNKESVIPLENILEERNPSEKEEVENLTTTTEDIHEKTQVITEQYRQITQLQESLDKALSEAAKLKETNQELSSKKQELDSQVKILQEKREKGLAEITKLTSLIDEIKTKNPNIKIPQQSIVIPPNLNKNISHPISQSPGVLVPTKTNSFSSISVSNNPKSAQLKSLPNQAKISNFLRGIKKDMNDLYKEVLVAATTENTLETQGSVKLDSSRSEASQISDSLFKIEKKTNDILFLLHEYIENME